jgi:1,4-alpha-glucan branching enzyme
LDESWGYQTVGYFASTSRFGTPDDFMYFIDYCHQNEIGVIIDWVPAHFPKDAHGLAYFDGTHLYEHADPKKREHKDWGTLIFNYGRTEVDNFLISNALFWLDRYHVDGLRVDAVASILYLDYSRSHGEWIPNVYGGNENLEAVALMKRFNEIVHQYHPGVLTIAEESTSWPMVSRPTYLGGLGFSLKWNMGWMHDTLLYFSKDPMYRKYHHNNLTFALLYAFTENFVLVLSHDEVVHGKRSMVDKMPGDLWQKFANLRLLYGYMYCQPGKKLLFMGGEFGQWHEWDCNKSVDWHLTEHEPHKKLQTWVTDLNKVYADEPALYEIDFSYEGFEWIDFGDYENSIVSFLRKAKNHDDFLICVFNLTPVPRHNYRIAVPKGGKYKELLNSDAEKYWGGNIGNYGEVWADEIWWQGRAFSLNLTLPPLGALVFKPVPPPKAEPPVEEPIQISTTEAAEASTTVIQTDAAIEITTEAQTAIETKAQKTVETKAQTAIETKAQKTVETKAQKTVEKTVETKAQTAIETKAEKTVETKDNVSTTKSQLTR